MSISGETLTTEAGGLAADESYFGRLPSLSPAAMVRAVSASMSCTTTVTAVLETIASALETGVQASPSHSSRSSTSVLAYSGVECETVNLVTTTVKTTTPVTSSTTYAFSDNSDAAYFFTEAIVDYLTRHPGEDCSAFCRQLYQSHQLSLAAASQLLTDMNRIQHIIGRYASNLIVQRAQVIEDPTKGDPDAYLRNELYLQSGQKL